MQSSLQFFSSQTHLPPSILVIHPIPSDNVHCPRPFICYSLGNQYLLTLWQLRKLNTELWELCLDICIHKAKPESLVVLYSCLLPLIRIKFQFFIRLTVDSLTQPRNLWQEMLSTQCYSASVCDFQEAKLWVIPFNVFFPSLCWLPLFFLKCWSWLAKLISWSINWSWKHWPSTYLINLFFLGNTRVWHEYACAVFLCDHAYSLP